MSKYIVRLGDSRRLRTDEWEQDFDIDRIIFHEDYADYPSHKDDIALIKLNQSAV